MLRAVGRYLRQVGVTYSQTYIAQALTTNVDLARLLVDLFETKFDPESGDDSAHPGAADERAGRQDQERAGRRGQS